MRCSILLVVLLLSISIVFADMPDCVLQWQSLKVIEQPGDDAVVECTALGDNSGYSAVVFNATSLDWTWSLLSLNRYGTETGRMILFTCRDVLEKWVTPVFTDDNTLAVFHGSRLEKSPATMRVYQIADEEYTDYPLDFAGYSSAVINSAVQLESGSLLLSGTGNDSDDRTMLFTAETDILGNIAWQSELPVGYFGFTVESTELEVLYDGSFLLSYEEDGFPGGMPLYRLGSEGQEMWEDFIDLNCEFTAASAGFLELSGGNILMAGSFDELGQMSYRGILQCYDPSLFELWSEEILYDDHTFLTSVDYTEGGDILCAGWTAADGFSPFETVDICPLLVFIYPDSGELVSYSVEDEADQTAEFIFSGGIGEYFIIGENIPENGYQSDVFFGRIVVRDQL